MFEVNNIMPLVAVVMGSKSDAEAMQPALDALKTLPVLKVTRAAHSFGSMVLRNDKNGRIK